MRMWNVLRRTLEISRSAKRWKKRSRRTMARRSATLKQFLLRVHPDHFRNVPKVHDENLQSIKLLNQFMDERHAPQRSRGYMMRSRVGSKEKVYFSVLVPVVSPSTQVQDQPLDEEVERELKRFSLELTTNIERKMTAILKECGVVVASSSSDDGSDSQPSAKKSPRRARKSKPAASTRGDEWQREQFWRARKACGMDFGDFTVGEMYAKANRASSASASRRRKKPIQSLQGLFEFMRAEETVVLQQQRQIAWQSIQSAKRTLQRELGIHDVLFSCGWSSMHLNTTIMVLLKTLRKYVHAHKQGIFSPRHFLEGVTIDISSNPSGIDFAEEYQIAVNPADVPLQWVEVLDKIDANMVIYMKAARESLAELQRDATAALGEAQITRGHTCSALGYRTFLQNMRDNGRGNLYGQNQHSEHGLLETLALTVEDNSNDWRILESGGVQVPWESSYDDVVAYLSQNRALIQRQRAEHAANLEAFAYIAARCAEAMGATNVTCGKGIPLADAIVACEELLKAVVGLTPQAAKEALPGEMVRFVDTYTQGRGICISRSFGLGQDGIFTLPVDWFKW